MNMPPEYVKYRIYDPRKETVRSIGVMIYQMLYGRPPYTDYAKYLDVLAGPPSFYNVSHGRLRKNLNFYLFLNLSHPDSTDSLPRLPDIVLKKLKCLNVTIEVFMGIRQPTWDEQLGTSCITPRTSGGRKSTERNSFHNWILVKLRC